MRKRPGEATRGDGECEGREIDAGDDLATVIGDVVTGGTITDASGRTLSGQTTEAFYNSLRHSDAISIGLNCALGAEELRQYVEELSRVANCYVSAHPNAGLPNEFGEYDETAEEMAAVVGEFAESGLVNLIGGCCGTRPEHIRALGKAVENRAPRKVPELPVRCRLSGLEPFNIGPDGVRHHVRLVPEPVSITGPRELVHDDGLKQGANKGKGD